MFSGVFGWGVSSNRCYSKRRLAVAIAIGKKPSLDQKRFSRSLSRFRGRTAKAKKERRRKHIAWLQSSKEVQERGKEGGIESSQIKTKLQVKVIGKKAEP